MFNQAMLPEVEVYSVLSNARRREVLTELWKQPESMSLRDLSERIATTESGERPAPRALRGSVYNALHQTHLPKLDSLGLVVYDPNRKTVRVCSQAGQLNRYMDVTTRIGVTWGEYYRALGVVGLVVTVGSLAAVPLLSTVDPLIPATACLLLFAGSTIYQLYAGRLGTGGQVTRLLARFF